MQNKRIYLFSKYATELIMMCIFVVLVVPGFKTDGNIFKQLFITVLTSLSFVIVADRVHVKPVVFAHGLVAMSSYWMIIAVCKQARFLLKNKPGIWISLFGYDKIAIIITVYVIVILFFMARLFVSWENKIFVEYYREFNKFATVAFIIFMAIVWIFGFFICRIGSDTGNSYNMELFEAVRRLKTITNGEYPYIFLGNIGIFIPFGVYSTVFLKGKLKFLLPFLPIVVSVLIELSQYLFSNGEADIDDVVMNILGFYIGILFKVVTDKIIQKRTDGAIKSFFIF